MTRALIIVSPPVILYAFYGTIYNDVYGSNIVTGIVFLTVFIAVKGILTSIATMMGLHNFKLHGTYNIPATLFTEIDAFSGVNTWR